MGIDGRPERDSKIRALNRLQKSESVESDPPYYNNASEKRRSTRRTASVGNLREESDLSSENDDGDGEDEDSPIGQGHFHAHAPTANIDDEASPDQNGKINTSQPSNLIPSASKDFDEGSDDENNEDFQSIPNQRSSVARKEPKVIIATRNRRKRKAITSDDDDEDADDEYNLNSLDSPENTDEKTLEAEKNPDSMKVKLRLPIQNTQTEGIITKSGRVSKPPKHESPTMPLRNRLRTSVADQRISLTREERYKLRTSRSSLNFDSGDQFQQTSPPRSKRRKTSQFAEQEFEVEEEEFSGGDEHGAFTGNRSGDGAVRRVVKMEEIEDPKMRRTRNSARRTEINDGAGSAPYTTRDDTALNGVAKSRRSLRSAGGRGKESDDEGGNSDSDGDFQMSSDEESEEQIDGCVEEHEISAGGPNGSQGDFHVRTRVKTRNARKRLPRRTVAPRRSKRQRTGDQAKRSFADEIAKSFRPRNESIRPSDYYDNAGADADGSVSSDDDDPRDGRRRSTRRAATRASDAIAVDVNKVDFLQNPMAIVDSGKSVRPKRTDRYSRHRNRLQPTGPDPSVSDDDMPGAASTVPIEPMKVDANISWDDIGGLDHHVRALKEMVFLPLMYPEVFEKFSMEAPKGVLFYGPPGTGKTLCARALAASCGMETETVEVPENYYPVTSVPLGDGHNATESHGNEKGKCSAANHGSPVIPASSGGAGKELLDRNTGERARGIAVAARRSSIELEPLEGNALKGESAENASLKSNDNDSTKTKDPTFAGESKTPVKSVRKKPRVAFFMRNGADCLSKWVGEAERQLRLTFEAAKRHQPAIIFFDEIDGLAPVRSSRQDQIHSSIVSTLLGLMDGLDARGKIVVIGATNRVDAIDPALRRPGRFDRELIFTLPNVSARQKILQIHTSQWSPPPKPYVLDAVAKMTVGYCGADLKALCSESAIRALRRRYPQIYNSNDKLLIDINQVRVSTRDFLSAMSEVIPASHRSARTFARPLSQRLLPVLGEALNVCIEILKKIFPPGLPADIGKREELKGNTNAKNSKYKSVSNEIHDLSSSDDEEIDMRTVDSKISNAGRIRPVPSYSMARHQPLRPRLLIYGFQGLGQVQLGPALLHHCEGCPVHSIDFPSLHADLGARSAEEALVTAFREAARSVPSILYLPHLHLWWASASLTLRTTLVIALKDLPSDLPLLVLATAEEEFNNLPPDVIELFGDLHHLHAPSEDCRREMFAPVIQAAQAQPKMSEAAAKKRQRQKILEVLPKAPAPQPKPLSKDEIARKLQSEDRYIRMLRMEMRDFAENLLRDRRFKPFWTPVDPTSAPDYYDIIKIPMDIQKIAANIDNGRYPTVLAMVNDFDIMVRNAIQYNPPNTEVGAAILRRAHGLIDIVHAWVDNLNPSLIETCNKIIMDRLSREKERAENDGNIARATNKDSGQIAEMEVNKGGKSGKVAQAAEEGEKRVVDVMDVDVIAPPVENDIRYKKNSKSAAPSGLLEYGHVGDSDVNESTEIYIPAREMQIQELETLAVDVSSGMTVDALEGLLVRCEKVLHDFRFSMDRNKAVREISATICLARDDPGLVGKLVV